MKKRNEATKLSNYKHVNVLEFFVVFFFLLGSKSGHFIALSVTNSLLVETYECQKVAVYSVISMWKQVSSS
jgi:hypothetical protein